MGYLTYILNAIGRGTQSQESTASVSGGTASKRKRPEEEEDLEIEASASVSSKNSLNSFRPIKRARMESGGRNLESPGQLQRIRNFFSSRFFKTPKPSQIQASEIETESDNNDNQENLENVHGSKKIEIIDLEEDDAYYEECSLKSPNNEVVHQSSSLSTLATFGGFTARSFHPSVEGSDTSSLHVDARVKSGPGHVILTQHEKQRRAQALSPEGVKSTFKSGFISRFDKYYTEKDVAKRAFYGGITKPKSSSKSRNAFKHVFQISEKERYRELLNRFGVIKYPALTGRTEILKNKPRSQSKPSPVVPLINVNRTTNDEPDTSVFSSTAIKDLSNAERQSSPGLDLAASPVLGRDKIASITPQTKSVLSEDDKELKAAVDNVTSPEYIKKLMSRYGPVARELERQIEREQERKGLAEKETEEVFSLLDKRLEEHLKITQAVVDETAKKDSEFDESQPTELPEITQEMQSVIRRAQRSGGEVLVDAHKIQITSKDIDTLSGLNWLNDEVINFYMQMIVARSENNKENFRSVYSFSTFFYPRLMDAGYNAVKRWTKKVDLFSYSLVLVPVHLGMHWCLATIDMDSKSIVYYDSMGGNNKGALRGLTNYLSEEHKTKKGSELDISGWKQIIAKKIPQQMNGSDCGMFTCKFAEYCSRKARFSFNQSNMPYFRKRMVYEIVKNKLIHP